MTDQLTNDSLDNLVEDDVSSGTIDFSVDDGFANSGEPGFRRRIDAGTLLFAGIVIASIVGLWSMRTLGRSSAANLAGGETVKDVREWVWSRSGRDADESLGGLELIDRLDKTRLNELQVPAEQLANPSPFQYFMENRKSVEVVNRSGDDVGDPDQRDRWPDVRDGNRRSGHFPGPGGAERPPGHGWRCLSRQSHG